MADYATVTGTIGAITGVIALVVSIKNYARVSARRLIYAFREPTLCERGSPQT